jgi:hypothetical protein
LANTLTVRVGVGGATVLGEQRISSQTKGNHTASSMTMREELVSVRSRQNDPCAST